MGTITETLIVFKQVQVGRGIETMAFTSQENQPYSLRYGFYNVVQIPTYFTEDFYNFKLGNS